MNHLFDRLIDRALKRVPLPAWRGDAPGIAVVESLSDPKSGTIPAPVDSVAADTDRSSAVPATPVVVTSDPIRPDRVTDRAESSEGMTLGQVIPDIRPGHAEKVDETTAPTISPPASESAEAPPRSDRHDPGAESRETSISRSISSPERPPTPAPATAPAGPFSSESAVHQDERTPATPVRRHPPTPGEPPHPTPILPIRSPGKSPSSPPVEETTEVTVTIGRIEVATPEPQQPARPAPPVPSPSPVHLTLSDYMARGNPREQ